MKRPVTSKGGFALVEILVAISILSIAFLAIISGVSNGILAISGNKNMTRAMIIAKSKMNEFVLYRYRGPDMKDVPVKEYPGFMFNRKTERFVHPLLGPLDAKRVEVEITWKERSRERRFRLSHVYMER